MPTYDDAALRGLLELQGEDSAIHRLEERRTTLPEAARLTELRGQIAELDADISIARKQSEEASREQSRIEGEIAMIDQKISREEDRLFSGKVANPKELAALQAEVESLKRKRSNTEDGLLEVMVSREGADGTLAGLEEERAAKGAEAADLEDRVSALTGDIEADLQTHRARRQEVAASVPEDLQKQYERIRDAKGGVGAAELRSGTCTGCHTKLPAVEVERLRAERGLQRCDNCRRILVIT